MIGNIFKSLKDSFMNKKIDKVMNQPDYHLPNVKQSNTRNPDVDTGLQISNANAQSWNVETHPEGRGDSYLVQDYKYDGKNQTLEVTYRDGFKCRYDGITKQQALDFNRADSKGRWAQKNLFPLSYTKI